MKAFGVRREHLLEALQRSDDGAARPAAGRRGFFGSLPWAAAPRRTRRARADMLFSSNSYLETTGWVRSRRDKAAVDKSGKPLPWYTYAGIHFIDARISSGMSVFEYGSGASTLWWAARVGAVVSCEYDSTWYKRMSGIIPGNVKLIHAPDRGNYAQQILSCNDRFDVVAIDGECRIECARCCVEALKQHGIIVWDNSDRAEYQDGFDFLARLKFRRLDFAGLGPINVYGWSTSVFYRSENCLGI
jgi:hypothetical protein